MTRVWVLSLGLAGALLAMGCGASTAISPEETGTTRYRTGDRIVYRYAGSLLAREVLLEERITDVNGLRLRIEVTARRPAVGEQPEEIARWIQVVTDTAENREADRVDELYEVTADGRATRLPNEDNEDLIQLYAWTLPSLEWGEPGEEHRQSRVLELAGRSYTCEVSTTALPNVAPDATVELSECPELVWTNGPGAIVRGGETVWSVEVIEIEEGR